MEKEQDYKSAHIFIRITVVKAARFLRFDSCPLPVANWAQKRCPRRKISGLSGTASSMKVYEFSKDFIFKVLPLFTL